MTPKSDMAKAFYSKSLENEVVCIEFENISKWYGVEKQENENKEIYKPITNTQLIKTLIIEIKQIETQSVSEDKLMEIIHQNLSKEEMILLLDKTVDLKITIDPEIVKKRFELEDDVLEGDVLTRDILKNLVKKKWSSSDPVVCHHSSGFKGDGSHSSNV
jgi:hypothetical protein